MKKILEVIDLNKSFVVKKRLFGENDVVSAVSHVSFSLNEREILGVVGESGCGKSTVARLLLHSIIPDSGKIIYKGKDFGPGCGEKRDKKEIFKAMQMVFQNPYSSLNPKMTVLDNITFGLLAGGMDEKKAKEKTLYYLNAVGMQESFLGKYPSSLSGGQRQRVAIARALAMEPAIILADEPVSSLDKSVQAQVLNLFKKLREDFGLSIIFVSHDLSVVEYMSDHIMVMYMGEVVEYGSAKDIYENPGHPYTRELLDSIPEIGKTGKDSLDVKEEPIEIPSPIHPPAGCRYHPRCPCRMSVCSCEEPHDVIIEDNHMARCHLYRKKNEEERG